MNGALKIRCFKVAAHYTTLPNTIQLDYPIVKSVHRLFVPSKVWDTRKVEASKLTKYVCTVSAIVSEVERGLSNNLVQPCPASQSCSEYCQAWK